MRVRASGVAALGLLLTLTACDGGSSGPGLQPMVVAPTTPTTPTVPTASTETFTGTVQVGSNVTIAVGASGNGLSFQWQKDGTGAMRMVEMPNSEFELKADLVLLAMGFLGPVQTGLLEQFRVERDARSNVKATTEDYRTSVDKVFSAGDMRRGQSLVVWAIREGRQCAHAIDAYLMGTSALPR